MSSLASKSLRSALKSSVAIAGAVLAMSGAGLANPAGGSVTTGTASISSTSRTTTVDQTSEGVVIDWSSFNIGSGQTTDFAQPNAQAIAINRIGGSSASQILGTLDANGRVVLINGNGLVFGKNARVNVGSLVATSTGGSDSDLLAGKFTKAGNSGAAVVNDGHIRASQGGLVALVAPNVTNAGTINAKLGHVTLGGTSKFTVDLAGDGLVSFAMKSATSGQVTNTGRIDGATVVLKASSAEGVAAGVVNVGGVIAAEGAHERGGEIVLDAGDGSLATTGRLDAAGEKGHGKIIEDANSVAIAGTVTAGKGGKWKVDPDNLTVGATAAGTISHALNQGTGVWEETSAGTASGYGTSSPGNGDIVIDSRIAWNTGAMLYLYSYHSIDFDATMNVKNGGCLSFEINNGGTGGVISFADGGHINIDTSGTSFTLNGTGYTVVDNVSTLASDIESDPSGNFVLGLSYNAKADGIYTSSPIATTFTGTFYGLGNTISDLSIDESSGSSAGLFADVGSGGLVSGLGMMGADILGAPGANTGALAGALSGSLYDDYSKGRVKGTGAVGGLVGAVNAGGSVNDSYSTATAIGIGRSVTGGLIGRDVSSGAVDGDYATGSVRAGGSSDVGGLIGAATSTQAEYDFATGAVSGGRGSDAGGLIGTASSASLSQAYSTGSVSGGTGSTVGGLIGYQSGPPDSALYWDLTTSGVGASQGVGNISNATGVTGLTTTEFQLGLPSGFDSSVWGENATINNGLPYLLAMPPA
jgi:filamentous hemagglutinin family protein